MTTTTAPTTDHDTTWVIAALTDDAAFPYILWPHQSSSAISLPVQDDTLISSTETAPALAYVDAFLSISRQFRRLLLQSRDYTFHDGMTSPLSDAVHGMVSSHGIIAVQALEQVLNARQSADIEAAEEVLRQVGLILHPPTHQARLQMLADMLKAPEGRIRDAALLGLSFLDNPQALCHLRCALEVETQPLLAEGLRQVIAQLERTTCLNI